MHLNTYISSLLKGFLLLIVFMVGYSCVSPYVADIEDEPDLISIEASLIKGEQDQIVKVSTTASLNSSTFIPVRGCDVSLIDEFDNAWHYNDLTGGIYRTSIPDEELIHGRHERSGFHPDGPFRDRGPDMAPETMINL